MPHRQSRRSAWRQQAQKVSTALLLALWLVELRRLRLMLQVSPS